MIFRIIIHFWETAHLPLPYANIYFSLRAKYWLRGGVDGQIPRNVERSDFSDKHNSNLSRRKSLKNVINISSSDVFNGCFY